MPNANIRVAWEYIKLWLDWHGRIATMLAIVVSLGGAALANRIAAIWGNVAGIYLWIVSILVFVVFVGGIMLTSRAAGARSKDSIDSTRDSTTQFFLLLKEKQRLESEVEKLEARPDLDKIPINAPMGVRYMTHSELTRSKKIERKKREIELINEKLKPK
jgi:cation transport ATPase